MSLWNKIKCFFGYHLWLEEWPDDWPMMDSQILPGTKVPQLGTREQAKKKGWTRKCLNCGKVQKREEWT